MASRTRQPKERGQREEKEEEEGGRQGKGEQKGEEKGVRRGKGGRGRGGNMRESVRPVQRWYAHSYRAGQKDPPPLVPPVKENNRKLHGGVRTRLL